MDSSLGTPDLSPTGRGGLTTSTDTCTHQSHEMTLYALSFQAVREPHTEIGSHHTAGNAFGVQ